MPNDKNISKSIIALLRKRNCSLHFRGLNDLRKQLTVRHVTLEKLRQVIDDLEARKRIVFTRIDSGGFNLMLLES